MKLSSKLARIRARYWRRRQCLDHAKLWEEIARELERKEKLERQSGIVKLDK